MIQRWDIVAIGNLSRNRYWGEGDDQARRPAICTSTLITGKGFRLLVDPSFGDKERMMTELDRRTGMKLSDIDTVFLTHEHGDHLAGLKHFSEAKWLAAPEVASIINSSGRYSKQVEAAPVRLFGSIDVIYTPGHTLNHHSLRFDCDGLSVVVAGDAVMTRDFWAERRGYFNSADFDTAARTIDQLATIADIIIPGHDNYFMVLE